MLGKFKLEDYLSKYEFSAPLLLCCSDAESFSMHELIAMASEAELNLWENLRLGYTEARGHPLLRESIYKNFYQTLTSKDQILVFSGAEEGIYCALLALCEPEDHVIVMTPSYQSLIEIPKQQGAEITELMLSPENNWRIDVNEIEQAIKPNTKLIVINFPHNPTGQVIEQVELEDLVNLCRRHDIWLFSDEVYRLLGQPRNAWASPAVLMYEKALSLGVMSKSFGMAGLRIGWIACQDEKLLKKIEQVKHYTSICPSGPAEILSLIAIANKHKLLERNNRIVSDNLAMLDTFMQVYKDLFEWVRPQGGCVGFVKYKGNDSGESFTQSLLSTKGVLLLPGSIYDFSDDYFRIGFGRKNMPEALEALQEFLDS